ncbi:uracil-DNA glycosylase [Candidatus Aerophobetes bacterium]|uniref:Uracil-DNA glycosylase n=1 Tax=Aerophobetes bacterium TaxID=2030807 RepID=A0A2A4YEA4_UNCAE|nr:MAG: uracil-DNA glycosylase [Candidatus Aerophobetes bacterium]
MAMTMSKSWHAALSEELKKPYINEIKKFLVKENALNQEIFPPEEEVFNAFSKTPFEKVKIVIMGQDPYHGKGQAHGLCFSVKKGIAPPPSLKNIYKEIQKDLGITPPTHGCLEPWASQGVLMLNATLTVRSGQPKSHYGIGWERFTDAVVEILCQKEDPIVFLLWGRSAIDKARNILDRTSHNHVILSCAHPSPFSATKFFGCKHFSKSNEYLVKWKKEPVNWKLEE